MTKNLLYWFYYSLGKQLALTIFAPAKGVEVEGSLMSESKNDGLTKDKCDNCGNDKSKCSSEDCYLKKTLLFKSCVETGML